MAETVTYGIGEVIVNENERSSDLYILVSGTIAVFKGTNKVAEINKPGKVIGEMSFFLNDKRSATLIAMTSTVLKKLQKDKIKDYFSSNPDFALNIVSSLAEKLSETTAKLQEIHGFKKKFERLKEEAKKDTALQTRLDRISEEHTKNEAQIKDLLNQQSLMSERIIQPFVTGTMSTVKDFLSADATKGTPFEFGKNPCEIDAASVVNIMGDCTGWYILAFPKSTALAMTHQMTGIDYTQYNEDVVNFIKEFNNIIIGIVVSALDEYKLTISTPTTVFGADTIQNMIKESSAVVIPFVTSLGDFYSITRIEFVK